MKILITGGSGFIGTNMINYFIKNNHRIVNIDILPPKILAHKQYWRNIDIRNYKKLSTEVQNFSPDCILHLAARTDLRGGNLEEYDSNTVGTQNIVNICKSYKNIKRVIFASSMLVNRVGYSPLNSNDYNPNTSYGESKVEMEKIIINSRMRTDWTIIRPTSIWGAWFGEPYSDFFHYVIKGLFVHPGEKACTKTYGYIDNSVLQISTLLLEADKSKINGRIFYIGDKPPINISDWADEIKNQYNNTKNIKVYFWVFSVAALFGDFLKLINIKFPLTSFRLKNMTTNNILPLDDLYDVVGVHTYTRLEGTKKTLEWIKKRS